MAPRTELGCTCSISEQDGQLINATLLLHSSATITIGLALIRV